MDLATSLMHVHSCICLSGNDWGNIDVKTAFTFEKSSHTNSAGFHTERGEGGGGGGVHIPPPEFDVL